MNDLTKEISFEESIEHHLLEHGYDKREGSSFDAEIALDKEQAISFVKETQPKEWEKLARFHGANIDAAFIKELCNNLDRQGTLKVLRHGFTDRGVHIRLAYFKEATGDNPELKAKYAANRLNVYRQVHHSVANPRDSVDVMIGLNGIPVVTMELKNPFTGQNVLNAINQYKDDRDPRDKIFQFKARSLVQFAVDPDEVYMTTRLAGRKTFFLPFNKGVDHASGNPNNPSGYKTAYLWEDVLEKHSLLDILSRFMHLQIKKEKDLQGKETTKEIMIFPRFHQLNVVRKLEAHTKNNGAGNNYLVQHSAGSGKSNSIAWLAHRLANLHKSGDKVFKSVVVITDRRVLDKQLQENIYQFEHKQGVVFKVKDDKSSKSAELAKALNLGSPIIICTLQTFSFVLDKVGDQKGKNFAVIVDEAHSSQGSEASTDVKVALGAGDPDKEEKPDDEKDYQDILIEDMESRGQHPNLSFYAFTATPKKKTIEMFGQYNEKSKQHEVNDDYVYSMKQAIQENFILDVLDNYMTYSTYFKFLKQVQDDPELSKKAAIKAIMKYFQFHEHNLTQKVAVMVEHFQSVTRPKIGGRAKAMVVTASRDHARRYKQAFDKFLKENKINNIKTLVAFSGSLKDPDNPSVEYTESSMNGFGEKELPDKFATPEFQILIVAEKYQTGFDQPLLHTMFVDKKLRDLRAVQTLARLNRTCEGKDDTFILDFVNTAEEIQKAFSPYYQKTVIDEPTDPNLLYRLKEQIYDSGAVWEQDVDDFAKIYFSAPKKVNSRQNNLLQGKLYASLGNVLNRFRDLDKDAQDQLRHDLNSYQRLYGSISQIVNFIDAELGKLFVFAKYLVKKLPARKREPGVDINGDIELGYYRLEKTFEGSASIDSSEGATVKGPKHTGGGGSPETTKQKLTEIVDEVNDKFGTELTEEDRLIFARWEEHHNDDAKLKEQANQNDFDGFYKVFKEQAVKTFIRDRKVDDDLSKRFMSEADFREGITKVFSRYLYQKLCQSPEQENSGTVEKADDLEGFEYLEPEHKQVVEWLIEQNEKSVRLIQEHEELAEFGAPLLTVPSKFAIYDLRDVTDLDAALPKALSDGTKVLAVDFENFEKSEAQAEVLALIGG